MIFANTMSILRAATWRDARWVLGLRNWSGYAAAVVVRLKVLAPYALIELVLPGGSVMALLLWLYRRRKSGLGFGRFPVRILSGDIAEELGRKVNSLGPDVNTSEINPSFRRAMGSADHIPLIVVHELTHTQKRRSGQMKLAYLLDQSIEEGAADFMTELVASSSINAYNKEWAEARHDELFQRFAADLKAKPNDTSQWLYNYRGGNDQPADLGYWIGAEICRSYYANAKDKREAIRNIVTLVNTESIVRNSRYASLLDTVR